MDEKQLKTSTWQRVVIVIVAILLLGSTVLAYMFIVMGSGSGRQNNDEEIARLEAEYTAKGQAYEEAAKPLSEKYFSEMQSYTSRVKSYNAATANNEKLKTEDLKVGTGRQLAEGDTDYFAYYIGWCPDGTILDSSFDYAEDDTEKDTPIGLKAPLDISNMSLIEGWNQGVIGMKLGGVRQVNIPGELAYGETSEKCGMTNAPLRYAIMAFTDDNLKQKSTELTEAYLNLYTALVGGATN